MAKDLSKHPLHLGLGATTVSQPTFTGDMPWYQAYSERHAADGAEGRLVSMHTFTESWDCWEMHPLGSEAVIVTEGKMVLVQEIPDGNGNKVTKTELTKGQVAVNPPGVWHTSELEKGSTCSAVFITAGKDTQHRPM